jgi:rsbT co-antagonist protein RsbR
MVQRRQDGSTFPAGLSLFGIQHASTERIEVAGIVVHDLKARNALEYARLQQAMISTQQDVIRELSTPVVPVFEGILVLPIIGTIDTERAQRITEVVLQEITASRAQVLIMDITGVSVVDTAVAASFLQTAAASHLLGAEVVLVGITPEVAQTIVQLGVALQGLVTRSDLRAGIEYALHRLGWAIVATGKRTLARAL